MKREKNIFGVFLKKLSYRNVDFNLKDLLDLDIKNRDLINQKEKLEQEKKIISKIKDKTQFAKSKNISIEIDKLDALQIKVNEEIISILSALPNVALDDVPVGKDEKENKEVEKAGKIIEFKFKPLSHFEIGKK